MTTQIRWVRTVKPWVKARTEQRRYEMARAAATDAGNAHMSAAGRTRWNADDWNAMCAEFARLMPEGGIVTADRDRQAEAAIDRREAAKQDIGEARLRGER